MNADGKGTTGNDDDDDVVVVGGGDDDDDKRLTRKLREHERKRNDLK